MSVELLELEIEDMTGQTRRKVRAPRDMTVTEFVADAQRALNQPDEEGGQSILYGARSSVGDALNPSDRIGDVLTDEATVTITRNVTAG